MKPEAIEVAPRKVLAQVAAAIPAEVHPNIVIIGSLAAGYWLFKGNASFGVRTKDIDCVLSPHLSAVEKVVRLQKGFLLPNGSHTLQAILKNPAKLGIQMTSFPLFGFILPAVANGSWSC